MWDRLLRDERARPIGLGARDSLRLEAGLPLYGHDLDETISPVEASLEFALSKRRREAADFLGAARMLGELAGKLGRRRVGLRVLEGAPAREGAEIVDAAGAVVGKVTSGGFSPSLPAPIAMGLRAASPGRAGRPAWCDRARQAPGRPGRRHAVRPSSLSPQARSLTPCVSNWAITSGSRPMATSPPLGISAYAAGQLGDVVFVELPNVGKALKAGDPFAVVESVKAASDVYAPVSGEVVEVNSELPA